MIWKGRNLDMQRQIKSDYEDFGSSKSGNPQKLDKIFESFRFLYVIKTSEFIPVELKFSRFKASKAIERLRRL